MAENSKGTVSAVRCEELLDEDQDELSAFSPWHTAYCEEL